MSELIKQKDKEYYMNTFGERLPVCFKYGKGINLYTDDDDCYYDFLGGIAVNALGHSHPTLVNAIKEQAEKLLHTSNLYYIENQTLLAEKIVENSSADKVFFANTGAEANEGAFKLAKMYFYKQNINKTEIISLDHSFHGRTLATVAATGNEKYQNPYKPLTPGFIQVEPNNFESLKAKVSDKTAAIIIELVQGESGVHPMDKEYVLALRKLCDEENIILIFDEVQTGMGRCGTLFCHDLYGVEPDIFTCAKALGGGVPIGAVCAKEFVAKAFEPGDHGTTFGGNPLATAAGLAVFKAYEEENLVENSNKMGKIFKQKLNILKEKYSNLICDIRGEGLLIGIEPKSEIAQEVYKKLFENKILTSNCYGTIRLAPPLNINEEEIDIFINTLDKILGGIK